MVSVILCPEVGSLGDLIIFPSCYDSNNLATTEHVFAWKPYTVAAVWPRELHFQKLCTTTVAILGAIILFFFASQQLVNTAHLNHAVDAFCTDLALAQISISRAYLRNQGALLT